MLRSSKTNAISNGAVPKERNNVGNRHNKGRNGSNATTKPTTSNKARVPFAPLMGTKNANNSKPIHSKPSQANFVLKTKVTKADAAKSTVATQKRQPFTVLHEDNGEESAKVTFQLAETEEDSDNDIENQSVVPSTSTERTVTEKSVVRQPLAPLLINKDDYKHSGSPMVIDISTTPESEELEDYAEAESEPTSEELAYFEDIYSYLRELETRTRPKPNYMRKQPDVTPGMRSILVDWLVEVTEEYKLNVETFYLAVFYIDRFLSCMSVVRDKLQLVGTACMFLAAKFEEVYPPEVEEFVYITDDTYTKKQVVRMEQIILRVLAFDLAMPTLNQFLQRFILAFKLDVETQHLASYLCELTQLEADPFLRFLPSNIACASVCLACHTLSKPVWTDEMALRTGYVIPDFKECMYYMHKSYCNAPSFAQQAIRDKYTNPKFNSVALIPPPETIP